VKVLRRRERRVLFGIKERNAGKSVDLSSICDDEPPGKRLARSQNDFCHGLLGRPEASPKAYNDMEVNNAMALTKPIHSGTARHVPAVLATALVMTLLGPSPRTLGETGRLPGLGRRVRPVILISGGKVKLARVARGDVVFIHAGRVTTLSRSSGAPLRRVRARPKQADLPGSRDESAYDPPLHRRPSEAPGRAKITIFSPGRRPAPSSRIRLSRLGTRGETPAAARGPSAGQASAFVCAFGAEFQP